MIFNLILLTSALSELDFGHGTSCSTHNTTLPVSTQASVCKLYKTMGHHVRSPLDLDPPSTSSLISLIARQYNCALFRGRRITPLFRSKRDNVGSSLIQARRSSRTFAGEILSVFHHIQRGLQTPLLTEVRWLLPWHESIESGPWLN